MVNAAEFAAYAGENLEHWRSIEGQRIMHSMWGNGTICQVRGKVETLEIHVQFDQPVNGSTEARRFLREAFNGVHIKEVSLPDAVEANRSQLREERERRKASAELREKYGVGSYKDDAEPSRLDSILQKLEQAARLSQEDIDWLNARALWPVLAKHYELIGRLASAGRCWRQAKQPRRALEITEGETSNPSVLTMRGGAYKDLGDLDSAENCANIAIDLAPDSYYPHNLLGAIHYVRGETKKGDDCFSKAIELGAPSHSVDRTIRSALEQLPKSEQRRAAEYLVAKDRIRYAWALKYLK